MRLFESRSSQASNSRPTKWDRGPYAGHGLEFARDVCLPRQLHDAAITGSEAFGHLRDLLEHVLAFHAGHLGRITPAILNNDGDPEQMMDTMNLRQRRL